MAGSGGSEASRGTSADAGPGARLTVVVVPRQRWSLAVRSLGAVLDRLPVGFHLVYVDGGSPAPTSAVLQQMVDAVGGTWIRRECILTGNEARNLALERAPDREYVLFVDNDVFPGHLWAERMIECADETGAALVAPVILHGASETSREVHIAGGRTRIVDGVFVENTHLHEFCQLDAVRDGLRREATGQLEFHAFLARRSVLDALGGFDEALLSMADHEDLVFSVQRLGLDVWIEPDAVVLYLNRVPLERAEVGFWQHRYSEAANNNSIDHFAAKWRLDPDQGWTALARVWAAAERTRWLHGRGRIAEAGGRILRRAFWNPVLSRPARALEQRIFRRRARVESARRMAVLGRP